jgi:hypothetical protein
LNAYIKEGKDDPAPVLLIFLKPDNPDSNFHFEVDLVDTRAKNEPWEIKDRETSKVLGKRHYFNEQVTHATHMKDAKAKDMLFASTLNSPAFCSWKTVCFAQT